MADHVRGVGRRHGVGALDSCVELILESGGLPDGVCSGTGCYGAGVPGIRLRVEVNMRSPDFGATAQASVCDLELVKAGRNPAGMVVCPNKLIINLSVSRWRT